MSEGDRLCISTNDDELIAIADKNGVQIDFKRPEELASDHASSSDVVSHALDYFKARGEEFEAVLLLQPTSPFRSHEDYERMMEQYDDQCDMVVSVKQSKENPYFTLFEEDESGYLQKSKEGHFTRRQDCPSVYAYNGSMYLINVKSFWRSGLGGLKKIKKVLMPDSRSVDIDTMADWVLAEFYCEKQI